MPSASSRGLKLSLPSRMRLSLVMLLLLIAATSCRTKRATIAQSLTASYSDTISCVASHADTVEARVEQVDFHIKLDTVDNVVQGVVKRVSIMRTSATASRTRAVAASDTTSSSIGTEFIQSQPPVVSLDINLLVIVILSIITIYILWKTNK